MEREGRWRVRGLEGPAKAQRVEAALYGRVGVHEVHADPVGGQVWLRYDDERVPPPRLQDYLREAGVEPTGEEPLP